MTAHVDKGLPFAEREGISSRYFARSKLNWDGPLCGDVSNRDD
jgi:hypothetical protein